MNWPDGGSNSLFAAFGALPDATQVWTGFDFTTDFETRYYTDPPDFTTPHVFHLLAGQTTLYLVGREADTFIGDITVEAVPTGPGQSNYEPYFFTTFAGPVGDRSIARFYFPEGAAVDSAGNIYVADTGNSTIRKIAPDGSVITLAGSADLHLGSA